MNEEKKSKPVFFTIWLDNARILAMFAVVLLHVSAGVVLGNDVGTEYWWFGNIYDSVVRWCVPVFVMISGALLLDSSKQEDFFTFYAKRLSRILVPILVWSIFFLAWAFFNNAAEGNELTGKELFKMIFSGKPHYHMWFLYMIACLYLFTPYFRKIVAHSSRKELIFLIVITFIMSALNHAYGVFSSGETKLFINWFLSYTPFFFLGHFIRHDDRYPSIFLLWGVFIISFISTFMGCYIVAINKDLNIGLYFYGYLSATVIPMSISLMYILRTWNKPIINDSVTNNLSILTLGIYLIHPMVLEIIEYKQYGAMSFHPMISIPVVACIVFVVSAGMAQVVYKIPYLRRSI